MTPSCRSLAYSALQGHGIVSLSNMPVPPVIFHDGYGLDSLMLFGAYSGPVRPLQCHPY